MRLRAPSMLAEAVARSERHNADTKEGVKEEMVAVFTGESITEEDPPNARQEERESSS